MKIYLKHTGEPVSEHQKMEVLAHRGVHLHWKRGLHDIFEGCEASHIYPLNHQYIENTIESVSAAFSMGATIVEIDIRQTKDSQLMVFHDRMLECRTNGTGKVIERNLDYLKQLDIGYGYTPDNGKTYPLRGSGVGMMPTLGELLSAFPRGKFLIDHKDGTMDSAEILASILQSLTDEQRRLISYWGPERCLKHIQRELPEFDRMFPNRRQVRSWVLKYLISFGSWDFPPEAEGLIIAMPHSVGRFFWGWPHRLVRKIHAAGGEFYLLVNSEEEVESARRLAVDGIVTDHIERIGTHFQ